MNSPFRSALGLTLAMTALIATPSLATHRIVRSDGTGDYPTLQAAVIAFTSGLPPADTLMLEPGYYDETVNFPSDFNRVIYAPAGAEATIVREMTSKPERPRGVSSTGRVVGVQLATRINWGNNVGYVRWEDCIFAGGWTSDVKSPDTASMAKVTGCTFRAETFLTRSVHDMVDCTFESAPVVARNSGSWLRFLRCRFTGPGARLVLATPQSNSEITFEECSFENAEVAIEVSPTQYSQQAVRAVRCVFESIDGAALQYVYGDPEIPEGGNLRVELTDCRISNTGYGVYCKTGSQIDLRLERDTILAVRRVAVQSTIRQGTINGLRISNAAGDGIVLRHHPTRINLGDAPNGSWSMLDCQVRRSGGDGIRIEQMPTFSWDPQEIAVRNCVSELNAGAGIVIASTHPIVSGCLSRGNGGDGLRATVVGDASACELSRNTVVGNDAHGVVVESASGWILPLTLERVLTTHNGGDGLAIRARYAGTASRNDSWANGGVAYSGLNDGEFNLELDPIYCMPSAGAFDLRADSPCSPSGIYGQIGALGVGCAVSTSAPLSAAGAAGLRIAPNPSRGPVAFAWGGTDGLNELIVFDLAGRRVWSASSSSLLDGALHWDARDSAGRRVPPGVYLARWRSGRASGISRVVLLDD